MKTFTAAELAEIIEKHHAWLMDSETGERANLRSADLSYADLSYADLSYANLRYANLSYADLRYARSIWGAVGNMEQVKSVQCDYWPVSYTHTHLQIGCQLHEIAEWWAFSEVEIARMDSHAPEWWAVWKPILASIISASPAVKIEEKSEQK